MVAPVRASRFGASGPEVPVVGQGSWHLESDEPLEARAALRRGVDLGMVHVDTAEMYGSGRAESLIGEALADRRDELFVVSKVLPHNASARGTRQACERTLSRLGTDRLDCYLLHWPGSHPLEDTLAAFERLQEEGKILRYGVSNFDEVELAEAVRLAGPGKIACNQVLYHLRERGIEHAVLPFCRKHDIALVGYTPFGDRGFPPAGPGVRVLQEVADRRGATLRQVTLAFLTREPGMLTIPKASKLAHTEENAGGGRLALEPSDLEAIDRAFPRGRRRPGVAML